MRTLWIVGGLLLAVCLAACGDELPTAAQSQQAASAAQEPQAEAAQQGSAAQAENQARSEAAATALQSETQEQQNDPAHEDQAEPAVESEAGAVEEESAEVRESAPSDLTEVPAVVVADAEMRVRPGLAWGVNRQLAAGDEVLVLSRISGWMHIRVDICEGWVRSDVLDLGEVDESDTFEQAAAPIIAEWQGVEYGVMGQSADAAEVRLLSESDEIVSAPKDEVTLLANDITVDDLPVLIGEETVVFPGDDFRAGQGKILPQADEWMWLPWGWLLAHNEEYIWQWRPEKDELEFIRRPPGRAGFSPGGESLAILTCGGEESCFPYLDVTILPLDGTPSVRLMEHAEVNPSLGALKAIDMLRCDDGWCDDFFWTSDGRGLLIPLVPDIATAAFAAGLLHVDRELAILNLAPRDSRLPGHCVPQRVPYGYGWRLSSDDLVAFLVRCEIDGDEPNLHLASYYANGQSITVGPALEFAEQASTEELPLSAMFGELSDDAFEIRGGTQGHSIVVAPESHQLFLHDKARREHRPVADVSKGIPEWFWRVLVRGPSLGQWDLYWTDHHVVVVARTHVTWVVAGLLVDLATADSLPLEIGSIRTWPCFPNGGWNPDGTIFQIEFQDFTSYEQLEDHWNDGTATPGGKIAQRQIVNSDGETLAVMRALAHLKFTVPTHIAGWSADGGWLAIGGHQELGHFCA